jgi:hypothetical protein
MGRFVSRRFLSVVILVTALLSVSSAPPSQACGVFFCSSCTCAGPICSSYCYINGTWCVFCWEGVMTIKEVRDNNYTDQCIFECCHLHEYYCPF